MHCSAQLKNSLHSNNLRHEALYLATYGRMILLTHRLKLNFKNRVNSEIHPIIKLIPYPLQGLTPLFQSNSFLALFGKALDLL